MNALTMKDALESFFDEKYSVGLVRYGEDCYAIVGGYPDGAECELRRGDFFRITEEYGRIQWLSRESLLKCWMDMRRQEVGSLLVYPAGKADTCSVCEDEEMNALLLPRALFRGDVVTRDVLSQIAQYSRDSDKDNSVLSKCSETLFTSDACWFKVKWSKNEWGKIVRIDPISDVGQARKMGIRPFEVPPMPSEYAKKSRKRLPGRKFTYSALYGAWKGMVEKVVADRSDETLRYPYYLTLAVHDTRECESVYEGKVTDFAGFARAVERVSGGTGLTVDVMWNDPWGPFSESTGFGISTIGEEITV